VRGLVHCHTVYSDGRHTIEQMARAADALGIRYLTITDHSPTASYAHGVATDRLRAQWDELARVQETVAVRLLRGTESDILADGALDYPDAILEQLDVIIASIHARHRMDAARMTERIVRAMRHPCFKIWGHALGRLILSRPPIAVDLERILDVIAESRAAIEINGDPHRLDLEPRLVRRARERSIPFVISTDAHATGELANLRYGVAMARRGWVRRGEVLNTLDVDAFRHAVSPRGGRAARHAGRSRQPTVR
jgi:DNA polymerase (family X)